MQFYGNYSFYVIKYFKGRLRGLESNGSKKKSELLSNGEKFILDMMPAYFKRHSKISEKTVADAKTVYFRRH